MEWINENVALITSRSGTAAILQQTGGWGSSARDHSYGSRHLYASAGVDHVTWGAGDNQPNVMGQLIQKNNQVRPLLESNRDMIYGTGLSFNRRIFDTVDGKTTKRLEPFYDDRLEDWVFHSRLANYLIGAINARLTNGNHFTRFTFEPDGTPILSLSDAFATRLGGPEGRASGQVLYNPYFGDVAYFRPRESEPLPRFNFADPAQHVSSIFHSREPQEGNPFYAYPSWWGAQDWVELANLIPIFHKSGLTNGYNIKYLVKVPKDYFDTEGGRSVAPEKIRQRWSDFSDNLSKWLAGTKNVNKSLILKYMRGDDGKALDAIDVVPLKNEMSDDAYSKVWEMANVSIANAAGILPTLAGVNPGKGNDSGSQIRVMAEFQQHFRTPVHHQILLEPIRYALRTMGYTDVIPSFSGVQITTLDTNPTGKQAVVNHN